MPDYFKRVDQTKLYGPFRRKMEQLVVNCARRGVDYYAISGMRTPEEQDALFAQGRTRTGPIVTKARGGQSAHNFGVAEDFCKDSDRERAGLQPDWDAEEYNILAEEAEKLGLEAGHRWKFKDSPHVQLPLSKYGITMKQLYNIYRSSGNMGAVWAYLDKFQW